ncbi:tyramine oxidase subunit B [Pseudoclavibacter sp. CFCC 11306]|uniref:tyramine oxidase subunit B n=1 Tax=Pseudoclavibacter sp. CFCC 11306 TaxID=1564493 RepID=UPI00130137D0|nr:tyramine oxidase subunit B [Pseudoclavibacter sp. CFCC 11306]KAB1659239.1 ornithine cyclodeaminase [Pseudoclavibacter sp. CFCC 11306]
MSVRVDSPTAAGPLAFRYLDEPALVRCGARDMAACMSTLDEMFRLLASGDYVMAGELGESHGLEMGFPDSSPFANMPMNGPDRRFAAMPAYLGGRFDMLGLKWYASNVDNRNKGLPRSIHMIALHDKDTGAPLCIMSGNLISAYRTAGVLGVGARMLAREDARVLAVIGPGAINIAAVEAYLVARPCIERIVVVGRSQSGIDHFAQALSARIRQLPEIVVVASVAEAVADADIVSVAISSDDPPTIATADLKPGALVCLPADISLDDEAWGQTTIVDSTKLYDQWMLEVPPPRESIRGLFGVQLAERCQADPESATPVSLADVFSGRHSGRRSDDEIIFFGTGGLPVEDIAWATELYRRATESDLGVRLPIWETPELR